MHNSLLHTILAKNTSELPVKDFLQKVVDEHPYFSPAHFFLLQQLHSDDEQYAPLAAKTALFFNNPYWLQFKLQHTAEEAPLKQAPVVALYANSKIEGDKVPGAFLASGFEKVNQPVEIFDTNSDNDDDSAVLVEAPGRNDQISINGNSETVVEEVVTGQAESSLPENTDNDDDNAVLVPDENQHEPMQEIKIDLAASLKSAENEQAPAFEPMHLVDYFASQGIKLSNEVQGADKLGRQLKSFTDWLKTMKKIHIPEQGAGLSGAEIAVQAMAEKSNTENEIVTEAMAEVFAQQGKVAKAAEVYQKLSLLNPAKSAYFAAQIEKLKG